MNTERKRFDGVALPRLREWRERRAMTQVGLSEASGVSQDGISGMERGVRRYVRPSTVRRLAQALDVDPADLMESPEVSGDPKEIAPRILRRRLDDEGVATAWALTGEEAVLTEGERLGNAAMRETLIPALRAEQKALGRIAAYPDLPSEVQALAAAYSQEAMYLMQRVLLEAWRRERTPEGRAALAKVERELWADAG